jgi:molecular chaperone IbpA
MAHYSLNRSNQEMRNFDTRHLTPFTIGIEAMLERLSETGSSGHASGFPPYDICQEDETNFRIDLALAGVKESEIDIQVANGILTIKSKEGLDDKSEIIKYLHKGISFRKFTRNFTLAEDIHVSGAGLENGLLTIKLKRIIPKEMKPIKIAINGTDRFIDKREFLKS